MNTIFHWIDNFLCWVIEHVLPVALPVVLVIIGVIAALLIVDWIFSLFEKIYYGLSYLSSLFMEPLIRLHHWRQEKRQERREKKGKKNPLAKIKTSSWDSLTVVGFVFILFLGSLAYLIISAIRSGDFWGFIEDNFFCRLPTMALFLNDFTSNIVDGMASAVITCLLLYYVNRKISDLDGFYKIFFNIAFIFIGWAIGTINPMYLFLPVYALCPLGQILIEADLLFLTGIPILWHIAHIILSILGCACIVLSIWLFMILGFAALRELFAPLAVTLVFFTIDVIIAQFISESATTVVMVISMIIGFIFYQIRKVTALADIDEDAEFTAEDHIDSISDWIVDIFDNIKDFVLEWAPRIWEWIKDAANWIKKCFTKQK